MIFLIWAGNDSTEWAGANQVALMLYFPQSLRRRSMPIVAPKTPREMSVGFAGLPSFVLILGRQLVGSLKNKVEKLLPAAHCIDIDAVSAKYSFRHDEKDIADQDGMR
jgi:hypothetical protein